jgi:acetyl esterase/lipase
VATEPAASTAVVPTPVPSITGWRRLLLRPFVATVRASLQVSPRPMAHLIRRQFARSAALTKAELDRHAPGGITEHRDERYGEGPEARLDVYVPERAAADGLRLPVIVWIHGGGWLGGGKTELRGYMKALAAHGFVAVAIDYALAPAARYPTPVRQAMAALRYVADEAVRFHVDPNRVLLGGDSAGAQIAAQVAALATNPEYVRAVGVGPTISGDRIRALALCCGPYDPALARDHAPFEGFVTTVLWSYSGTREWRSNTYFATSSIPDNVTAAFPPAFVTVGNADPLAEHSQALVAALTGHGVEVDALFFPPDHEPPLAHEYQFRLDGAEAQHALSRIVDFFRRHA